MAHRLTDLLINKVSERHESLAQKTLLISPLRGGDGCTGRGTAWVIDLLSNKEFDGHDRLDENLYE